MVVIYDSSAAVRLPPGEDINEWLAVNGKLQRVVSIVICKVHLTYSVIISIGYQIAIDFFNQVVLLYGGVTEYCTPKTCEVMSAGPRYSFYHSIQ